MKKLVYLCLIVFSVSIIHAETQYVQGNFKLGVNPTTGSYEAVTLAPNQAQLSNLPLRDGGNSSQITPSFFLYEPYQNAAFAFSTRIHPIPEDPDVLDTARDFHSKVYSDPDSMINIGDTYIPQNVVDENGNPIYKLNGFFQLVPSMKYYVPGFQSGTVTIDSVVFWLYPTPSKPVKHFFYFAIIPFNDNIPGLGTDLFNPFTFALPYSETVDKVNDVFTMDANFVNNQIEDKGNGSFSIKPTVVPISSYTLNHTYDINQPMLLTIFKDDIGDLDDVVGLIGAWEWYLSYAHTFAGVIKHQPDNNDSLVLLSQFRLIRDNPTQFRKEYPGIDTLLRKNYRFIVYGRFTGEYSSVNKTEEFSNSFSLEQNAPNPVSSTTKISFSTNITSYTTLKVYNQLGECVATLVNETLTPGVYNTDFDASNLVPGLYFYSLTSGNQTKTLPMMIAR